MTDIPPVKSKYMPNPYIRYRTAPVKDTGYHKSCRKLITVFHYQPNKLGRNSFSIIRKTERKCQYALSLCIAYRKFF